MEGLAIHRTSTNVKEQNTLLGPRSLFLLHSVGQFNLHMGVFPCIHREAITWHCLNKQKFNLLLRIKLSACVWPEGKIHNLKVMHPANPISSWHSAPATLLEMAQLQVPAHHPPNGLLPLPNIVQHHLWDSFEELDYSGIMVAHKTLKENKTCLSKTSALTQKKKKKKKAKPEARGFGWGIPQSARTL